jgi:hypothetical protein
MRSLKEHVMPRPDGDLGFPIPFYYNGEWLMQCPGPPGNPEGVDPAMNLRLGRWGHAAVGLACVAAPVTYVAGTHVGWERSTDAKKRMLTHQATFWGTMLSSLALMHVAFFLKWNSSYRTAMQIGLWLVSAGLPIAGFEGGARLGKALYPYTPKPATSTGRVYRPGYLA